MDQAAEIDFSHSGLDFALHGQGGLRTTRFGLPGRAAWHDPGSPDRVFAVHANGQVIDGATAGLTVERVEVTELDDGSRDTAIHLRYDPEALALTYHIVAYADTALTERWLSVRNAGDRPVQIDRIDSISLDIPSDAYELISFTSAWGLEFEEVREPLVGDMVLETRKGRSSNERHPWFALARADGDALSGSAMWSGNWVFRLERRDEGGYRVSGGLHDWEFAKTPAPGESVEGAHVALVLGSQPELNDISAEYAAVGRRHWYPRNALSRSLPVEWNHWFSYIDKSIDEDVFERNVDEAARLGLDVCTLDAGWFGPSDEKTHWYDLRGDWDVVNTARFPSGIRALSDYTHEKGLKFGLWCEIEGLGQHAVLAETRPEFVARRDGERLGYVCFGNPAVQEWAFATLDRLITDYALDWVKLDFNLDPGAGCNRTDHGHDQGDGLYEHYQGYYRMLERLRERHPEVILESCSSGGLRIDLGLLQRTHLTFLSDPDWPEHDLQIFWGASTMLAPEMCLHWGWCEWTSSKHPHQTFDPCDPNLTQHQLDYYVRTGMLGAFGYSQKLPDLPAWVSERLAYHARVYKDVVRRFVREGAVLRLTGQPRREGRGDRWAGFQYALPDGAEHLLFVFRLHGGEPRRTLRLRGLDPERVYTVIGTTDETETEARGSALMEQGLIFTDLPEEGSEIFLVR
ncbi:MAG: alpha-galactosidase [Thermomicrobiales bacterium]